jgi:hypothetical protein
LTKYILYGDSNTKRPTIKRPEDTVLQDMIQEFEKSNVEYLGEFKSLIAILCDHGEKKRLVMTCINAMDLILKQIDLQFATTTKR